MNLNVKLFVKIYAVFLSLIAANFAYGTVGLGGAYLAPSDGKWRPAINAGWQSEDNFLSKAYYYGLTSSSFKQNNFLFNINYKKDLGLFSSKNTWLFGIGPSLFFQHTKNSYFNKSQYQGSLGVNFGVHWRILNFSVFALTLSYEGNVFPAGFSILVLSYDRIQAASITLEVML